MNAIVTLPQPTRRMTGQRQALIATAHVRLMVLMLLIGAAYFLVVARIAMLGLIGSPASAATIGGGLMQRADIIDRNGAPLARTIAAWTIGVHPREILGDRHAIAEQLAQIMPEQNADYYYAQLTRNVPFTYLDRHASPARVNAVHALGEPAMAFAQEAERLYPQSTLAAHVLGYVSPTANDPRVMGRAGMERAFDDRLSLPSEHGTPLPLSIDARVQAAMESELGRAMVDFQARGATGIVLDVRTGEVISMASLPVYNPNKLKGTTADSLRNNVTQSVYELGSTFKPITMATAIDTGTITDMGRRFDATAPLKVGGFTIHDERGDPKRWLNIPETLIYSSNVATARIADELGPERMQGMFRKLGFDKKPQVELREKGRPLWPQYWARTTTMTTAYGHGIAITPLQLAAAYAALVNGGMWRAPTLLKTGADHPVSAGQRVISDATSARMRQLLRLVCLYGTGRKGDVAGYRVGGKTGTAEAAANGGYDHSRNVATFVAAFPMDAPRYVVLAMLDSPQATKDTYGWKTAAWNAAPVVGRVIARTGAMLGVIPDARRDVDISDLRPMLSLVTSAQAPTGGSEQ